MRSGAGGFVGRWFLDRQDRRDQGEGDDDSGDGDPEGWEADWAGVGGGGNTRVWLEKRPVVVFYVDESTCAPNSHPVRRGRHGVAGDSIGL
jgi:hypothetical protein